MKLFVLAFLAFSAAAQAAPTQHLTGFTQANPSCASGYQIYSAGEADGARVVHCLIGRTECLRPCGMRWKANAAPSFSSGSNSKKAS